MTEVHYQNILMSEQHPEDPKDGDTAHRLIQYEDPYGYRMWEHFQAQYELEECGDAENGPQVRLYIGRWKQVRYGGGTTTLKELLATGDEKNTAEVPF